MIHRESRAGILQIGAGAERLVARARQHDDADVLVVMRLAIALCDTGDHIAVQRVALLRPVDGDPERLPALFGNDAYGVGHGTLASLLPFAAICGRSGSPRKGKLQRRVTIACGRNFASRLNYGLWPLS